MISEFVEYVKQVWKNKPNVSSPLNADRLNHMEDGIENNSNKIKEIVPAVNKLTEKSKKAIIIKQVTSKTNFEVGANSALQYGTDATLFPTIEGYTRIGFIGARTNNEVGIIIYDNGWMSNPQNMNKTFTITLTWVFVKNELLT